MSVVLQEGAVTIDSTDVEWQFVRASGPGGQNVNKVASVVQLRFNAAGCDSLSPPVRQRLIHLAGRRATLEGVIVIDARRFRTQDRNRQDALQRLADLLQRASELPKTRRKTRPSLAAKRRRLDQKRQKSAKKRLRGALSPSHE